MIISGYSVLGFFFCLGQLALTIVPFVPILSIEAYRAHYQLHNVKPAIHLDASLPHQYWGGIPPESLDLVVNINMIHISPFACTEVLQNWLHARRLNDVQLK